MTDAGNRTSDTIPLIGENHAYYLSKWDRQNNPARYSGMNAAALILTPFWLAYRHLYDWLMVCMAGYVLLLTAASFLPWTLHVTGSTIDPTLSQFAFVTAGILLIHLGFGIKANALYYRRIDRLKNKPNTSPLFYRSGASMKSGIITGFFALLFAVFISIPVVNWTFNPPLEPGIYVFSDDRPVPEGILDVKDEPEFIKYEARINLLFIHDEPIGDRTFRLLLEREKEDADGMEVTRDRSFSIFSSREVTLDLLDSEDPLTDTGTYHLTIFLDDHPVADTVFSISL